MAPSLTEMAFALGLGDRVVGVTRFCRTPPAARVLPKVGGFLDPNYEEIVALEPDLVLVMQSHGEVAARLHQLGIDTLQTDQESLDGVVQSIMAIADRCGVPERGRQLSKSLTDRIDAVRRRVSDRRPVPVLVIVGRDFGSGRIGSVWAAGRGTFYDDAVSLAGGRNVAAVLGSVYPELGPEGLLRLDPEVIVDVVASPDGQPIDVAHIAADWQDMSQLRAVSEHRVEVLTGDVMVIPGPRVARVVEAMALAIHPYLAEDGNR